jgi:SNF2 family DNA or RNA helicase
LSYHPAKPPFKHQLQALEAIQRKPDDPTDADVYALLMEQGTGKTKVILDEFGTREDAKDCRNLLVIAPKGVYRNWELIEAPTHLNPELLERTGIACWKSGANVTEKRRLESFLRKSDRPRILVMNVEALSTVKEARELCEEFIGQRRTIVAVDESTRIKGFKAARTKAVIDLTRRAYGRRIMSGLVTPRSCLDLYSQFEFLDYRILGFRSYYAFRARYAILKKQTFKPRGANKEREVNLVVGYRNQEELREKIAAYSFRVLKEDCLDLPAKIYMPPREVPLTDEQVKVIKQLKLTAQAQLDSGAMISTTMKMTTLLRMHQVLCGHVKDEDGVEHPVKSNRVEQLMEVLDEHSGKAIIWSGFRFSILEIVERLKKEYGPQSVVHYFGDTKDANRQIAVNRFQKDPGCRFFVANPQTGSMGITLTAASLVVYYSNTWSLEDRMQSEDRAHRAGLQHKVTYVDLKGEGSTMEDRLIKSLRAKLDIATVISGDSYREWIV